MRSPRMADARRNVRTRHSVHGRFHGIRMVAFFLVSLYERARRRPEEPRL
jgi:hypothetical protein